MSDHTPLSAFSKIINDKDQWDANWYSWLKDLASFVDDLSARVDNVNYGKFLATCSADQIPGPGLSQVAFDTEDTGSALFDTSSFSYLPDKAGWYTIYLQVWADEGEAEIALNGVPIAIGTFMAVDSVTSVQTLVFLSPGDSIQGYVNIVDPGTTVYSDRTGTFMFGWLVSA